MVKMTAKLGFDLQPKSCGAALTKNVIKNLYVNFGLLLVSLDMRRGIFLVL